MTMTGVPIKRKRWIQRHTHREDDVDRHREEPVKTQETGRMLPATSKETSGLPAAGRGKERSFAQDSEGAQPCHTLILYFQPPELGNNKFWFL